MQDDEFTEGGGHRRQFAVAAASAFSVFLIAAAVVGVHPWRDMAVHGLAVDGTVTPTSSGNPFASSVSSPSAVSDSDPAFSAAPAVSPVPISSPPSEPSPHPSASTRHTSLGVPAVADESHLNFKVSMHVSPTHVMLGQQTRVTVTVLNEGHGVDPPAVVSIGSMVPSDDFSDAPSGCTIANGGVECPISALQAGREKTIAFTVTTGYYPGDTWDDDVFGQLGYADSYGQQQQVQPGYSADLFVQAGTPSAAPSGSGAPSPASPPSSAAPSTGA